MKHIGCWNYTTLQLYITDHMKRWFQMTWLSNMSKKHLSNGKYHRQHRQNVSWTWTEDNIISDRKNDVEETAAILILVFIFHQSGKNDARTYVSSGREKDVNNVCEMMNFFWTRIIFEKFQEATIPYFERMDEQCTLGKFVGIKL